MSFPYCVPVFSAAFPFKAAITHYRNTLETKTDYILHSGKSTTVLC